MGDAAAAVNVVLVNDGINGRWEGTTLAAPNLGTGDAGQRGQVVRYTGPKGAWRPGAWGRNEVVRYTNGLR